MCCGKNDARGEVDYSMRNGGAGMVHGTFGSWFMVKGSWFAVNKTKTVKTPSVDFTLSSSVYAKCHVFVF